MLRRKGSLLLLSPLCQGRSTQRCSMALSRVVFSSGYCGLRPLNPQKEVCLLPTNFHSDADSVYGAHCHSFLNLKSCLDPRDSPFRRANDELQKRHATAPYRQLVRDTFVDRGIDLGTKLNNGPDTLKHRRVPGFPPHPLPEKLTVAVDVDEVLGNFLPALNKFIADRYCSNHSVSEYHVYEFFRVWKCPRAEADIRVHEFFKTSYFTKGIHPIPGARQVLDRLSPFCNLSVVTSRQNVIKDHTLEWIEEHYSGLFQEIHFGNHFALDGKSRSKSEICRSLGAQVLIDDNPHYALECAEVGIKALLFDYDNSYPWSKSDSAILHPFVTKVHNWDEVEKAVLSLIVA